jgi:hypothetical protein
MKAYISAFLVTVVSLCAVWVTVFYMALGNPVSKSRWIADIYQLKEQAALAVSGEKVVFVSGSNIVFGLDSQKLAKNWNLPVVNFGAHGGLGIAYILERSKRVLNAGDIAILPLEYNFYQDDGIISETLITHAFSNDLEYFRSLSLVDKARFIAKTRFKILKKGLIASLRNDAGSEDTSPADNSRMGEYRVDNMNAHGDQINLEPEKISSRARHKITKIKSPLPLKMRKSVPSEYSRDVLRDYISWAEGKGVCLIFMPPNYMYFDGYKEPVYRQFFTKLKAFITGEGVPYIGDPYDYMYDRSYYFGTVYHLDSLGVEKRTRQVMADIGGNPKALCKPQY